MPQKIQERVALTNDHDAFLYFYAFLHSIFVVQKRVTVFANCKLANPKKWKKLQFAILLFAFCSQVERQNAKNVKFGIFAFCFCTPSGTALNKQG